MDWLKEKPGLQWMLNTLSSVLLILLAFWLTGWSSSKKDADECIKELQISKAPYAYVDERDHVLEAKLKEKADVSLVESMDRKLDLILQKMK